MMEYAIFTSLLSCSDFFMDETAIRRAFTRLGVQIRPITYRIGYDELSNRAEAVAPSGRGIPFVNNFDPIINNRISFKITRGDLCSYLMFSM